MKKYNHPLVVECDLEKEKADGIYDSPEVIRISDGIKGITKLETLIHEKGHHMIRAHMPGFKKLIGNKGEERLVARLAEEMSDFLWKNGVRIVDSLK